MKCPFCGYEESKVIDSRPTDEGEKIRRRRECLQCQKRFTTYEIIETLPIVVVKKDKSRQVFDRTKLTSGMISWDAVEGASYYIIEYTLADGRTMERQVGKLSTGAYSNAISCRVRAVTEDLVNYRPSAWSESIAITGK